MKLVCIAGALALLITCQTLKTEVSPPISPPQPALITESIPRFVREKPALSEHISVIVAAKTGARLERLNTLTENLTVQKDQIFTDALALLDQEYFDAMALLKDGSDGENGETESSKIAQMRALWHEGFRVNQISHTHEGTSYLEASINIEYFFEQLRTIDALPDDFLSALYAVIAAQAQQAAS